MFPIFAYSGNKIKPRRKLRDVNNRSITANRISIVKIDSP